jgi:hypothetical protein
VFVPRLTRASVVVIGQFALLTFVVVGSVPADEVNIGASLALGTAVAVTTRCAIGPQDGGS